MKEIKFAGEIRDGKLIIYSRELLNADISKQKDQRVLGTLKTMARKRSLKQNGVLHWYLNEIADHTGMDMAKIKEALKYKFVSKPLLDTNDQEMVDEDTGEVLSYIPSTTEMSTLEMLEFTDKIRLWAQDFLGLILPLPDEDHELKFDDNGNINNKTNGR